MRSRIVLAALVLLLLGGALPAAAAAPFGSFGKLGNGNAISGQLPIIGWALDDNGVFAVDIVVDGAVVMRAVYGVNRPSVSRKFPGFPDSAKPGFEAFLNTTDFENGIHEVTVLITSKQAGSPPETKLLPAKRIQFNNASHQQRPFGKITFPDDDAEMLGRCTVGAAPRYSVIIGYALDAGSGEASHDGGGVAWVELLLDGALFLNTKNNCTWSVPMGGLSNCYGIPSRELTYVYPWIRDSDRAKYRFVIDVGALISSGLYVRGHHRLSVRAGDFSDNVGVIDSRVVSFFCDEDIPNEKSQGKLEVPNLEQPWAGTITVKGWAIDIDTIASIIIKINGLQVGTTTPSGSRPDVFELYPSYPASSSSGYTFALDTTQFNDGPVTLEVWVRDARGDETLVGEGTFVIDNP